MGLIELKNLDNTTKTKYQILLLNPICRFHTFMNYQTPPLCWGARVRQIVHTNIYSPNIFTSLTPCSPLICSHLFCTSFYPYSFRMQDRLLRYVCTYSTCRYMFNVILQYRCTVQVPAVEHIRNATEIVDQNLFFLCKQERSLQRSYRIILLFYYRKTVLVDATLAWIQIKQNRFL